MADETGKALSGALVASPASSTSAKAEPLAKCKGCGSVHGGVGAEHHCMRREIDRLRALLKVANKIGPLFLLAGCAGAPFTTIDNLVGYEHVAGDASGIEPIVGADAADVHAPGSDAGDVTMADGSTFQTVPDADPPPVDASPAVDTGTAPALCMPTATTCPMCDPSRVPCCKTGNVCGCAFGQGQTCL